MESEAQQVFSREEYAKKEFWQGRYSGKKVFFDWYVEYPQLKESFQSAYGLSKSARILMLGCGNSKLSEQMYDAGYCDIVNIDISESVVEQMKASTDAKNKNMKWLTMDGCDLKFPAQSFDIVIDKGTLDAVICGKNLTVSTKMLLQAKRVLKPTGKIIVITHSPPQGRKRVFEQPLPFGEFDYYFIKLGLSDTSLLINLMRSNLRDKPLKGIINNKEALQRSIIEYKLLQIAKKMKKTTKYKIYWTQLTQKDTVGLEDPLKEQPSMKHPSNQQSEEKLPTEVRQESQPIITGQQKKSTYNPQKQSHCYVYCIQQKPHRVISHLQSTYKSTEEAPVQEIIQSMSLDNVVHDACMKTFEVNPEVEECLIVSTGLPYTLLLAVKHLQTQNRKFPRLIVDYSNQPHRAHSLQHDPTPEKSIIARLNYMLLPQQQYQASVLSSVKATFRFKINLETSNNIGFGKEVFVFVEQLQCFVDELGSTMKGLSQLSPRIYSVLLNISERSGRSMKELLEKYWQADLLINDMTNSNSRVVIDATISLPPGSQLDSVVQLLKGQFKQYELIVDQVDQGFLSENPQWLVKFLSEFGKSYLSEDTDLQPVCDFRQYFGLLHIPTRDSRVQYLQLSKPHAASILAALVCHSVNTL